MYNELGRACISFGLSVKPHIADCRRRQSIFNDNGNNLIDKPIKASRDLTWHLSTIVGIFQSMAEPFFLVVADDNHCHTHHAVLAPSQNLRRIVGPMKQLEVSAEYNIDSLSFNLLSNIYIPFCGAPLCCRLNGRRSRCTSNPPSLDLWSLSNCKDVSKLVNKHRDTVARLDRGANVVAFAMDLCHLYCELIYTFKKQPATRVTHHYSPRLHVITMPVMSSCSGKDDPRDRRYCIPLDLRLACGMDST